MNQTKTFRGLYKWPAVVLMMAAFSAASLLMSLLPFGSRRRRSLRTRTTSFFSDIALGIFGVHVQVKHRERLREHRKGRLVIANHVSYVDIVVLSSLAPLVFITSVEMKHTPLLGRVAAWGGSLFVERRRPAGLKQEIEEIARVLSEGFSVVLFPEGTTSNGERVHPFKRSLFDAAVSAGADILPLCLRYTAIDGKPPSRDNRDDLFYHGGTRFSEHFPRFLTLRSVDVELQVLPSIKVHDTSSRKELAARGHECISRAFEPRGPGGPKGEEQ